MTIVFSFCSRLVDRASQPKHVTHDDNEDGVGENTKEMCELLWGLLYMPYST